MILAVKWIFCRRRSAFREAQKRLLAVVLDLLAVNASRSRVRILDAATLPQRSK